jgi:hypothetical protein
VRRYHDPDINHGRIALEATFDMRYEEDRQKVMANGAERGMSRRRAAMIPPSGYLRRVI